jgi:dihydroneopterin aldolase/2-amino-4-hydroxy-6-hydroxymethyldihydropteridine diphosphokinase
VPERADRCVPERPDRGVPERPDRIELRGLRALGCHGALPGEQDNPQPFEIDLDVECDLARAGVTDGLADTVDYGALAAAAARVVADERWTLLERLAQRVAEDVIGSDPRIRAVTLTIRKLRPPVPVDLRSAGVRVTRRRRRAFLGLGANLGERERTLREAVAALPDVVAVSPVYETEPVGGPAGQPPYLNLVVELATARPPRELLSVAHRLEAAAGRDRTGEQRHGPRALDVDVLWVEGERVEEPDLVVPHPRMGERRFVLAPLSDLAPDVVPAGWEQQAAGSVRRLGTL